MANQAVFEKKFVEKYTDWDLEESYFDAMKDPDNFDSLWEQVERYKAEGGKMANSCQTLRTKRSFCGTGRRLWQTSL